MSDLLNSTDHLLLDRRSDSTIDISVILCLHREGILVLPTIRSLTEALYYAAAEGVRCELIIVLDAVDVSTRECLSKSELWLLRDGVVCERV
jgi:hypothetical protein